LTLLIGAFKDIYLPTSSGIMKARRVWLIGFTLLLQIAATTVFADVEFALIAEDSRAKTAVPPPGKALIYVFRQDAAAPKNVPMWLDNQPIGFIAPRSYFLWAVDPGEHVIASNPDRSVALTVKIEKGRNYFVEQGIATNGVKVELRQVSYAQGRSAVNRCRLIKDKSVFAAAALDRPVTKKGPERVVKPAPKPLPATSAPAHKQGLALIIKTGSIKLSSSSQSLQTTSGTVPVEFESKASSPLGLEGEWRINNGFALGIEYIHYSNKLTATGTGLTSTMDVTGLLVNGKKYFAPGGIYYPYLGVGVGTASADFSGSAITGNTADFAIQAMGGLEMRWNQFGVYTELKAFSAKTKDNAGNKVDASSRGLLVGASIMF
jgi:hypothetical protein